MPAKTEILTAAKAELDRQAVMDLLLEASIVAEVLERLAGTCPTKLTDELTTKIEVVAEELLGEWAYNVEGTSPGPREELDEASIEGARERFRALAKNGTSHGG